VRSWIYSSFAFLHHQSELREAVTVGHDSGLYEGTFFLTGRESSVRIGHFCCVNDAVFAVNGSVRLGDYTFVAYGVTFSDGPVAVPPDSRTLAKGAHIEVGENVWIGARATVLGGAQIGDGSVVGALSVVDSAIPPLSVCAGNPARVVGQVTNRRPPHRGPAG
jgi:acetyltransferase-like isoleucine patch superfamily enzyme